MAPEEIKAARESLGLSTSQMADALRLAQPNGKTTVRQWESGTRQISGPAAVAIELMLRLHEPTDEMLDLGSRHEDWDYRNTEDENRKAAGEVWRVMAGAAQGEEFVTF